MVSSPDVGKLAHAPASKAPIRKDARWRQNTASAAAPGCLPHRIPHGKQKRPTFLFYNSLRHTSSDVSPNWPGLIDRPIKSCCCFFFNEPGLAAA